MDRHYNGQRGKQRKQKAKHRQNTTQKYKDRTTQSTTFTVGLSMLIYTMGVCIRGNI
jgi:hypothetical protein